MDLEALIAGIEAQRVLPVLRSDSWEDAVATAIALAEEGARVVELTTSTPNVELAVEALAPRGLTVGVGTLRDHLSARRMISAGAAFAVSFFNPPKFIETVIANGAVPIPGALTPSEIAEASAEGARIVKLFPAWQTHPRILADLEPLVPGQRYIATGISGADQGRAWLQKGILALGVGRQLGTVADVGAEEVKARYAALKRDLELPSSVVTRSH